MSDLESHILDDERWERRSRYWRTLVDEILASIPDADEWPRTNNNFYGDGKTPFPREDQSICDGRSWRADRAFSIQEQVPGLRAAPLNGWVKDYVAAMTQFPDIHDLGEATRWFDETPPDQRPPRSDLVLFVEESEEVDSAARALLEVWLRPATTVDEMKKVLEQTLRLRP